MTVRDAVLSVLTEEASIIAMDCNETKESVFNRLLKELELYEASVCRILSDPRTIDAYKSCETLEEFPIALINAEIVPETTYSTIPHMAYTFLSQ